MKFIKNYKNMTILLAALIIIFGALVAITAPKGESDLTGEYKQVTVKITNRWTKRNIITKQTRYYATVEYDNKEYQMVLSSPLLTNQMYFHNGKLYRSLDELERGIKYEQALPIYRISLGIVFVSVIAFIYYLAAFIQNRGK